jgi:hypothetical protein
MMELIVAFLLVNVPKKRGLLVCPDLTRNTDMMKLTVTIRNFVTAPRKL